MKRRRVFTVRWNSATKAWLVKERGLGAIVGGGSTRRAAAKIGVYHCRLLSGRGIACQLVIFNRSDGRLSEERTYLADPERYEG